MVTLNAFLFLSGIKFSRQIIDIDPKICLQKGVVVAQSVEPATPGEEVPGSIPALATRSLLVGSVSV